MNKNTNNKQYDTPILLMGFVRHQTAQKVFNEIRKIKPKKFYLAVDGPREGRPDDVIACQKTRDIIKQIDWDCEIHTQFQDKNLGCGTGSVAAINWLFENEETGIIFDDDCIADPTFFRFCNELLEYYKNNEKIMHISGNNFQKGKKRGLSSYYFSKYTHGWGWATWRRAWKHMDFKMVSPELQKHIWDKQWLLSVEKSGGLAILPNVNLVSNIGFGAGSTHTEELTEHLNLPVQSMRFPLKHPKFIIRHRIADFKSYREIFGGSYKLYFYTKILKIIPRSIKTFIKSNMSK